MNRVIRNVSITAATLGLAAVLAACGQNGGSSMPGMPGMPGMSMTSPPSGGASGAQNHNAADVTFATNMIPHHRQAVTMAQMALKQATTDQVKALAKDVEAAQAPEIQTMSAWLTTWGQPVPTGDTMPDMSGMGGMSDGTTSGMDGMTGMNGMMTDQEMQQLASAAGTSFDKLWLQMMIKHHQGALEMATTEATTGQNVDAKQLAQAIIAAQTKEIATMQQILPTITG